MSRVGSFDPKSEKKQPTDQIENVASSEMVLLFMPHPFLRPPVMHFFEWKGINVIWNVIQISKL